MATPRRKWSTTTCTDEAVRAAVLNTATTPDLLKDAILAVLDLAKSMETDFEGNRSIVGCAMAEQIRHEISVALGGDQLVKCQHCAQSIEQLPSGFWVDAEGFGACVKGGLWRDPLNDKVMRRPAVEHAPMPVIEIGDNQ